MNYVVYAIRCRNTNRTYIGSTKDFERRVYAHFAELRSGKKNCHSAARLRPKTPTKWQEDFDTYGADSFEVIVVEKDVPAEERAKREQYYIQKYDAIGNGYNIRCAYNPKT